MILNNYTIIIAIVEVKLTCADFQHTNFSKTNPLPLPDLSLINPLSHTPKNISEEALMSCSYLEGMLLCIIKCLVNSNNYNGQVLYNI